MSSRRTTVVQPDERVSCVGVSHSFGRLVPPRSGPHPLNVASDVGGLRELATAVVPRDVDAAGLAHAVDELLTSPPARNEHHPLEKTVRAHRDAYGLA